MKRDEFMMYFSLLTIIGCVADAKKGGEGREWAGKGRGGFGEGREGEKARKGKRKGSPFPCLSVSSPFKSFLLSPLLLALATLSTTSRKGRTREHLHPP